MQTTQTMDTDLMQELTRIEYYLEHEPANPHLLASAIDLHLAAGQTAQARNLADTATSLHPDDVFLRQRLGNVLIAQGELAQAERLFVALHRNSPHPALAYNLGYLCFRQQRYTDAHDWLAPWVMNEEIPGDTIKLYIRVLHHLGELAHAVQFVERHRDGHSNDPDFLSLASLLYLDSGQMDLAEQLNTEALALGSQSLETSVAGGTIALGHGNTDAASRHFAQALRSNPADGRSWSGLGLASMMNRDIPGAITRLESAVTHMPSHIGTHHALGWCRILDQDLSAAETCFRTALSLDRNFGESHGGLAVTAALQGDREFAQECIERAIRLNPESMSAAYAQLILSDGVADTVKLRGLVRRFAGKRSGTPDGNLLKALLNSLET